MEEKSRPDNPLVLLIGSVDHEGITSLLHQTGRQYRKKSLHSSAKNWQTIIDLMDTCAVSTALAKVTPYTYQLLVNPEFTVIRDQLFSRISPLPHAVFVYESLCTGINTQDVEGHEISVNDGNMLRTEIREEVNRFFENHNINIITYRRSSEVTVLAQDFLARCESGLLLRLYVPNDRLWAREAEKILVLFNDYLTRVVAANVRLSQNRTKKGVIYELHDDPKHAVAISDELANFSKLIDLCDTDMAQAEVILQASGINPLEITPILKIFARDVKRLQLDMRHEFQAKMLSIRHRLESELIDLIPSKFSDEYLEMLVDTVVPQLTSRMNAIRLAPPLAGKNLTMIVNNPQIVNAVSAVVAKEIYGDISQNVNDLELFRLFAEHAAEKRADLESDLRELKDDSAPKAGRTVAKKNIQNFLRGLGERAADVTVGILQSYIEKQLGI